jgi:two-component system capsular synthesis sensor histidine kinase RcsC
MESDNASMRKLTTTSLRLNLLLVIAVTLAFLLIGTSYWGVDRLIQEVRDKLNFHFSRLMGDIREHEDFLVRVARPTDEATQKLDTEVIPLQRKLLQANDRISLFEGREFSFAMPFTLAVPTDAVKRPENAGVFSLGVMMANFYSSYWTTSRYPATQAFLLDLEGFTSLAVPAIDSFPGHVALSRQTYQAVIQRVLDRIQTHPPVKHGNEVIWGAAGRFSGYVEGNELIAYISAQIPDKLWLSGDPNRHVVAASLLDLNRINDFALVLDRAVFDDIELHSPRGDVLVESSVDTEGLEDDINFTLQGLMFKFSSTNESGWTAIYRVGYDSFFRYAKWHLLVLCTVLLASIIGSLLTLRWYALRVVAPARRAHGYVVESDAFGRTLIQTVPVALCVLRRHPPYIVMENRLAEEWLGGDSTVAQLSGEWFEGLAPQGRESYSLINGRHLHVILNPTRYKGEDVLFCTFSDVTAHKEAENALAEARQSAIAASEAKSVFLATMSHEIRTPLYGVLGTLELLGLTSLSAQQREYLGTIQFSSSILLQLISDILDISKIESGQMALDSVAFSPLDLAEDVLRTYAASARSKGLQIYCCVDIGVPGRVLGDASRIRQILGNLLNNAIKFTDIGRVVLRLRRVDRKGQAASLEWQVTDTGIGIAQEKQLNLFEPFYQVHGQQHTISGTGLGLSICWRLGQMMGGTLRVVSEAGLGSSFTFGLTLEVVDEQLQGAEDIQLNRETVFVRAPAKELASWLCDWLNHWGAVCATGSDALDKVSEQTVLVDLLPEALPDLEWKGERIICSSDGQSQPEAVTGGWKVNLYTLRGIARAVALAQGANPLREMPPAEATKPQKLGLKVLVAEDNPINLLLLKEQLEELGCSVTLSSNGQEAFLRWRPGAFDAVLTDVNMPQMNGYELAEAIRRQDASIPIIGVTANAMREEGERCMAVGMNSWIVKPMSLLTLRENLCSLCGIADNAASTPPIAAEPAGPIKLSAKMRGVFIKTMQEDLQSARGALLDGDCNGVQQMLHRMRGAFVVTQAHSLADACGDIESSLLNQPLSPLLVDSTQRLLDEIAEAVNAL